MGHFVTLRSGLESVVFYVVGIYNVLMYIAIAFSNPGWLDEKQKNQTNRLVSDKPLLKSAFKDIKYLSVSLRNK